MIVPFEMIDREALHNLVEEFVSRDGTDNGYDQSLADRVEQVMRMLKSNELVVVFEQTTETANILPKDQAASIVHDDCTNRNY